MSSGAQDLDLGSFTHCVLDLGSFTYCVFCSVLCTITELHVQSSGGSVEIGR